MPSVRSHFLATAIMRGRAWRTARPTITRYVPGFHLGLEAWQCFGSRDIAGKCTLVSRDLFLTFYLRNNFRLRKAVK